MLNDVVMITPGCLWLQRTAQDLPGLLAASTLRKKSIARHDFTNLAEFFAMDTVSCVNSMGK